MKINLNFLFYFFGFFMEDIFVTSEYNIKKAIPSYLHHKFKNVKEDIFPKSIKVKLLSWNIPGTLLYSMDSRMNQLIVTLHDEVIPTIGIDFRNVAKYQPLSKICGCKICRFELLELELRISDKIYIECNKIKEQLIYSNKTEWSDVYPLPYSKVNQTLLSLNEAHLWLVNTPNDKGLNHNPSQMSGCIYNVWYNNEPIKFTNIVGNIENNCKKACNDDICNKGQCLETFLENPICNCTKTFLNGAYCNTTFLKTNYEFIEKTFQFDMFKISWKTSSKDLLSISNSMNKIQIHQIGEELVFEYSSSTDVISKHILTRRYVPNKRYILIAVFTDNFIDLQFHNGSWHQFKLFSYISLKKEIFTFIKLRSDDGIMEFVVKPSIKDTKWRNLDLSKSIELNLNNINVNSSSPIKIQAATINEKRLWLIILIVIILPALFINGILTWYIFRLKKTNKKGLKKRNEKGYELIPSETRQTFSERMREFTESLQTLSGDSLIKPTIKKKLEYFVILEGSRPRTDNIIPHFDNINDLMIWACTPMAVIFKVNNQQLNPDVI